jgi:hypothetical protein
MKVIYVQFRSVVLNHLHSYLSKSIELEPVYVLGDKIFLTHPDFLYTPCQSIKDARNGVPHNVYRNNIQAYSDDIFFSEMDNVKEMALSMMGRQSEDEWTFSYPERVRHFRFLCNYWRVVLTDKKPDIAIFRVIPHFASEYILFNVCKFLNIRTITYTTCGPFNYAYTITDINNQSDAFTSNYDLGMVSNKSLQYINSFIDTCSRHGGNEIPKYLRDDIKSQIKSESIFGVILRIFKDLITILLYINQSSAETIKKNTFPIYSSKSEQTMRSLKIHQWRARRQIKENKKTYLSMCSDEQLGNYVLFAPNYQPEASTMPDAGKYHDILEIIDILSSTLPDGWSIVYKEHPVIFNYPSDTFFRGHLFRSGDFYNRIIQYGAKIIDYRSDIFKLIDEAKVVATAAGTIAVQASIRGRNTITFGDNWYSSFSQIYKYSNRNNLKIYFNNIDDKWQDTHDSWRKYLASIHDQGFPSPDLLDPSQTYEIFVKNNKGYLMTVKKEIENNEK